MDSSVSFLSCSVTPGLYSVIEHVSGERWDNLSVLSTDFLVETQVVSAEEFGVVDVVSAGTNQNPVNESLFSALNSFTAGDLQYDSNEQVLTWEQPGWYQVQRSQNLESVCESAESCTLEPGVYQVSNLTTGQRWAGIIIPQL